MNKRPDSKPVDIRSKINTPASSMSTALPLAVFMIIYLMAFSVLEDYRSLDYYYLLVPADFHIPFIKYFVIPYLLWFFWIPFAAIYTFYTDENTFKSLSRLLISGMTCFLIISMIFPTKLMLRPVVVPGDDIFCLLCKFVYSIDTPTNVFPSIHVYNTCVALWALMRGTGSLCSVKNFRLINIFIAVSICLSTLFMRQHSILDVLAALIMFIIFVNTERSRSRRSSRMHITGGKN